MKIKEKKREKKREKKLKELYTRYNQCRDAELDRFWKNSVFVWCFLLLCFTALGMLIFDHNTEYGCKLLHKGLEKDDYYLFSLTISVFGLVLSNIWVWMAQGLKAWYEVFETAIWQMETYDNVFEFPKEYTIDNFWVVKNTNNSLQKFFVGSAPISTSRIVILIGRLLVIFWGCTFVVFLCKYSNASFWCCKDWKFYFGIFGWWALWIAFNFKFWLCIISISIILFLSKLLIQSSTLLTDGEKEIHTSLMKAVRNIINEKRNLIVPEKDAYQFVFQNTYETVERKIKKCIEFVAKVNNVSLTQDIRNHVYQKVLTKIETLNDYDIFEEVVTALTFSGNIDIKISIVRFLCFRRFNIDFKGHNNFESIFNLKKDFTCLKNIVKSKYFTITEVKKVNEKRIKVRCCAIHYWRDLFNCDIYNLHDDEL